jgi:hypothetical protein
MMPDELTNTDKKMIWSDHDLLVRLNTTNDMMVKQLSEFMLRYEKGHEDVVQRITALEVKQATNMEKLQANADDIAALQKKSGMWDLGNSIAVGIAAALGWFGK